MRLLAVENWLRTPADRDIIARWTRAVREETPLALQHTLRLPTLPAEATDVWEFLVLGDTGDADAAGPHEAPQDAVALQLTRDALAPVGQGQGQMVLHTGDVIYMTGERRLYERNFRRPYSAFLTANSTIDAMTFRLPFLPVPGNHDYYDLGSWAKWLARVPLLGSGLRAIAHELFAFGLPEGGSDMGRAYMEAFVAQSDADATAPYVPGAQTRLPNRYYRFTVGNADFFALDSNTLDAPLPDANATVIHREARHLRQELDKKAQELDETLRREQKTRDERRKAERRTVVAEAARSQAVRQAAVSLEEQIAALVTALESTPDTGTTKANTRAAVTIAQRRWQEGLADFQSTVGRGDDEAAARALDRLDEASDAVCESLLLVEAHLGTLAGGSRERQHLTTASDAVEQAQSDCSAAVEPWAKEMDARIHALSEAALDVQRELALALRRERYRPDDYDTAQITWLEATLDESERERPGNWRIVYLHHPLYTAIGNHAEGSDVTGLRDNLLTRLQSAGRVHLVLSGHSHAFEWFRSEALPNVGVFVSGGGGQMTVRATILETERAGRHPERYGALYRAGIREYASASVGPAAPDGEDGPLYHHLRIVVRPDVIEVRPVGSRWLRERNQFRREEPMPVFYAADLPADSSGLRTAVRALECIEVRRDRPPVARWS